ncbi:MAG: DNA polymerase III subunit alpha [Alphaproteobacteria bacterium]|nr:DNA polymerase III subunit alpha [Alphaproteobacteria bacterium]
MAASPCYAPFVPLRIFSGFSMLEGAIEPKDIAKHAAALRFPAAALTDRNGLYGALAFSEACAAKGVQPIIGALLGVVRPGRPEGTAPVIDYLPVYAQDEAGYLNLCALVSAAHLESPDHEDAHVPFAALDGRTEGLIALTGGVEGALVKLIAEDQPAAAADYIARLQALFPARLYVEITRLGEEAERRSESALIALADAHGLPLVATNPASYATADFHPAHDAMLCISASSYVESADRAHSSPQAWLKPVEDMQALFADLPDALANTLVVAQRCAFMAPRRKPILPSIAGDIVAETAQIWLDAKNGLEARLAHVPADAHSQYRERLDFELNIIVKMGFAGYFLIVADFIKWAKREDIPVGPGRGSGAGSVVAWALTITDLDPIKLGLLFERFLNPERVSMPDFDIDFCETRREEVIRYVQGKYGRDQVAQIITFGRLKARAVLKDTGRVLQMSYGQVDRLAKLIPNLPTDPWTLERALNGVSELAAEYKGSPQVRHLFDLAMKLDGLPRHSSTHAAGVVIGDRPLAQLVPLYRDPRSDMPVTQFDMKYAEAAGLVKFDFLGLKTLSVIHEAVRLIAARTGTAPDMEALGWDDEAVYALLQRGDTVGVFQLESEGMRRTLAAVRPTCFEDIIALVALYRPGPMDNIPAFGNRKNGREGISYPHPLLEGILKETYGIIVYQEQVMQAAQILAGYSLGEADLLRRAMGKKIQSEMDAQRARFVEGCGRQDIAPDYANELFDVIDKFAGYGFNKSHAAAYALLSYQTAWLKAHYPHEFYAASMSYDISLTDKLNVFVDDMRRMGVVCLPPCINASEAAFGVEISGEHPAVRYALGALKNVGEGAMKTLVEERDENGAFTSLEHFAGRISARLINKRQMESLAAAGAFDALGLERASVHGGAEYILAVAAQAEDARTSGQHGLFGEAAGAVEPIRLPETHWAAAERMANEREAFGFYFSAHPVDRYKHLAQAHGARSFVQLCAQPAPADGARTSATMAALVEEVRWRTSQRGRRYATIKCSDATGQFEANCFEDEVARALEDEAKAGGCALLTVELDRQPGEESPRIAIRARQKFEGLAANTRLKADIEVADVGAVLALGAMLGSERGGRGEVLLHVPLDGDRQTTLRLGRDFALDADLAARIEALPGVSRVDLGPALRLVG